MLLSPYSAQYTADAQEPSSLHHNDAVSHDVRTALSLGTTKGMSKGCKHTRTTTALSGSITSTHTIPVGTTQIILYWSCGMTGLIELVSKRGYKDRSQ